VRVLALVRHQRRIFERSAKLTKHRNASGAERMIADACLDPRRRSALAHQLEGVDPVQGIARQLAVATDRAEQRPLASAAMPVPSI
jgi:hypothetical protein